MKKIIISINPTLVKNILSGVKKFEYGTKVAKKNIQSIIVYCTYPIMKIIAEIEVKSIISDTPEKLWKITKNNSGITKEFFMNYFNNKKIAYAYKLGKITEFKKPKDLKDFGFNHAPQSFIYVN